MLWWVNERHEGGWETDRGGTKEKNGGKIKHLAGFGSAGVLRLLLRLPHTHARTHTEGQAHSQQQKE